MLKKLVIAGVFAATAMLPAASQAAGFELGIHGPNGSVSIHGNGVVEVTGRDWRDGDHRRWNNDRPRYDRLSDWQVRRIVRDAGYYEVRVIDERRSTYILRGVNERGRDRLITVDAYSGEILSVERLRR